MTEPRAPHFNELDEVIGFLNQSLRSDKNWSIASEYPTALNAQNIHNLRIIKDKEKILSHALIKPLIVKTPIAIFKVAAIGSVVTDSANRGHGMSRQILESCLAESRHQDCDFAILWTNIFDFYRKFGFELAGHELSAVIDQNLNFDSKGLVIREGTNIDPNAIHKLYNKHTVGAVRTVEEIRAYLKIPNSRVYTAWDITGQIVAYAVEGKGADLDGYVHEWGGGTREVLALIQHIRLKQKRDITVILPTHSVNLIQQLRQAGVLIHDGHLGMIKILQPEKFLSKINRQIRSTSGVNNFEITKNDQDYRLTAGSYTLEIKDESELIQLIFGPTRPSDLYQIDANAVEMLDHILPIRMWFWGWDSV